MYDELSADKRAPSSVVPGSEPIFWTEQHTLASLVLRPGLDRLSSITVLTGKSGTGKTALVRHLLRTCPTDVTIGLLPNVLAGEANLKLCTLVAFDQDASDAPDSVLLYRFEQFLLGELDASRRAVLIIDEAHHLSSNHLEELSQLTELNATGILLSLVLVGQPPLQRMLMRPECRRIRQRVGAAFHLPALNRDETARYIRHRCAWAGASVELFDGAALDEVTRISGGIPRTINLLCDLCLSCACSKGVRVIGGSLVRCVAEDARKHGTLVDLSEGEMPLAATESPAVLRGAPLSRRSYFAPDRSVEEEDQISEPARTKVPNLEHQSTADSFIWSDSVGTAISPALRRRRDSKTRSVLVETGAVASTRTFNWKRGNLFRGRLNVLPDSTGTDRAPATVDSSTETEAAGSVSREARTALKEPAAHEVKKEPSDNITDGGPLQLDVRDPRTHRPSFSGGVMFLTVSFPLVVGAFAALLIGGSPPMSFGLDPLKVWAASSRFHLSSAIAGDATLLSPGNEAASGKDSGVVHDPANSLPSVLAPGPAPTVSTPPSLSPIGHALWKLGNLENPSVRDNEIADFPPSAPSPERGDLGQVKDARSHRQILARVGLSPPPIPVEWPAIVADLADRVETRKALVTGPLSSSDDEDAEMTSGADRDPAAQFHRALEIAGRDPTAAIVAYARAALMGHHRAAYYLGQIYETGDGVPTDFALARAWYERAAVSDDRARTLLGGVPEPELQGAIAVPLLLFAGRSGAMRADFVWTSGEGKDPAYYILEIAVAPEDGPLETFRLKSSAANLPVGKEADYWRIVAVDADSGIAASDWQRIPEPAEQGATGDRHPDVRPAVTTPIPIGGAPPRRGRCKLGCTAAASRQMWRKLARAS